MKYALAVLLVALAVPRGLRVGANKRLIEGWWKDLEKLEYVASYCRDLRRQVLSGDFRSADQAVAALQAHLGTSGRIRSARFAVASSQKTLRKVALVERALTLRALPVDEHEVHRMAERIGTLAFGAQHPVSPPVLDLEFVPGLEATLLFTPFVVSKKWFIVGLAHQPDTGLAAHVAGHVQAHSLAWSFNERVRGAALVPANEPSLRSDYQASRSEIVAFISKVGAMCTALRSRGADPVVLVGETAAASLYLRPYRWGAGNWQCPLPEEVSLRDGDPRAGEPATVLINETPVYSFDTPYGDCYVVPAAMVRSLQVGGAGAASALSIEWTQLDEERLRFVVSYRAKFR